MTPVAQAACNQWDVGGKWDLYQSNGFNTTVVITPSGSELRGRAQTQSSKFKSTQPIIAGTLDGRINGNRLTFTVYWNNNSVGVYTGIIAPTGKIEGTTYDKWHSGNRAAWYSLGRMKCRS